MRRVNGIEPKLTREQIAEVRTIAELRRRLPTNEELAERFGVSGSTIGRATHGYLYKHYLGDKP